MDSNSKIYESKKRTRKWIIVGLIIATVFFIYIQIASVSVPNLYPLTDSVGKKYYRYIVPVSEKDKTYLMVVSYEYGFNDPYEVFKIYYVSLGGQFKSPLKAVVYRSVLNLEDIDKVRFYRESVDPNSPITVVLPLKGDYKHDIIWKFTPPETFPSELLEKEYEKSGFRTYHGWNPGF